MNFQLLLHHFCSCCCCCCCGCRTTCVTHFKADKPQTHRTTRLMTASGELDICVHFYTTMMRMTLVSANEHPLSLTVRTWSNATFKLTKPRDDNDNDEDEAKEEEEGKTRTKHGNKCTRLEFSYYRRHMFSYASGSSRHHRLLGILLSTLSVVVAVPYDFYQFANINPEHGLRVLLAIATAHDQT